MTEPVASRNTARAMLATDRADGETLHEAKAKSAHRTLSLHNALETLNHIAEFAAEHLGRSGGWAAGAAPITTLMLNAAAVHNDWKAGREIGAARERDIKNTTALLLAQQSLGEAYVNAELARMHEAYDKGSTVDRDAWRVSVLKLVSRVQAEAGGVEQAARIFNAAADEGKATAERLHLTNEAQIGLQCSIDPDFRRRFESDPAFRHGVRAYAAASPRVQ
jgi:hypothetical protein